MTLTDITEASGKIHPLLSTLHTKFLWFPPLASAPRACRFCQSRVVVRQFLHNREPILSRATPPHTHSRYSVELLCSLPRAGSTSASMNAILRRLGKLVFESLCIHVENLHWNLSWFAFCCCNKILTKCNLGRKVVHFIINYTIHHEGTRSRTHNECCLNWLASKITSSSLSYTQDHLPKGSMAHRELAPPPLPSIN